jgi:DNA-binding CsgD family transcriptional regulator
LRSAIPVGDPLFIWVQPGVALCATLRKHSIKSLSCSLRAIVQKKIADEQNVTVGTVHWHLANMRTQFGVHKTRELVDMLANSCIEAVPNAQQASRIHLSPRGKEALELLMSGHSYLETAKEMGISINGVRSHVNTMRWSNGYKTLDELISRYRAQLAAEKDENSDNNEADATS